MVVPYLYSRRKRALDVVLSGGALLVAAPVIALAALAVRLESPGHPFYRQHRVGQDGHGFEVIKLRTMVSGAERIGAGLALDAGDDRITRVGKWLRRTSVDELPNLLNIARGEMSLVGPRPLILEEDAHVLEWARKRLDLKPGITGLWQVLGRSDIPFDEMTKLDYVYVTNWSLREDIRLVLLTIPSLLRPRRAF